MNIKKLIELRNAKKAEMEGLLGKAVTEERAMDETEKAKFDALEAEIRSLDGTIKAYEASQKLEIIEGKEEEKAEEDVEKAEERAFAAHIRGEILENRAETLSKSANGAVVPKSIANRIIEKVEELSPIYAMATKYNTKGELVFPVYDETTEAVTVAYAAEFSALTSTSGKFTTVSLTGFLAGALTKVSKSLVNNSDFDLVNYVVGKMAQAIARFLEKECLVGTNLKMTGVLSSTAGITAASATAITSDELIDLQMVVPEIFQENASWIMHKNTFKKIRQLKDLDGNYILNRDATKAFGWELLGKPVYVSKNMPEIAATNKAIVYGDFSGLHVKLVENMDIQVLNEKYADEHAVGVVGWVEADSKIVEPQKIAVLTMKSA